MKAIINTKYGGPEVLKLKEVEKPTHKSNEVLICVRAASVTKADTMMRTGKPYFGRLFMGLTKPKNPIPGTGFAGIIDSVGADVTLFKIGDKVFGENIESFGAQAEFVCVSEDGIIATLPENMDFKEAASVCDGALTSMNFLKNLGAIKGGKKVLINGASGSLGTSAVQIAKYFGAEVTGVCSTANVELVKSLGADHVVDYTKDDFTTKSNSYDIIYDTVGKSSFSDCKNALTKDGVYLSPVLGMRLLRNMFFTSLFGTKKARFSATGILPASELKILLKEVIEMINMRQLTTVIDRSYQLERIVEAHTYVDKGHKRGNVIVSISK